MKGHLLRGGNPSQRRLMGQKDEQSKYREKIKERTVKVNTTPKEKKKEKGWKNKSCEK